MNFDWRAQFLWDETSTLRIITCDSEVTGERGPGLCLELLFFSLYRLLCSKPPVVPHLPQRKTQRKKKALMWPVGPQQDQASFSSHLSCHHSPLGSLCSNSSGPQTQSCLRTLALDTCYLESSFPALLQVFAQRKCQWGHHILNCKLPLHSLSSFPVLFFSMALITN